MSYRTLEDGTAWPTSYSIGDEIIEAEPDVLVYTRRDEDELEAVFAELDKTPLVAVRIHESHLLEGRFTLPYVYTKEGRRIIGLGSIAKFATENQS